MPSPESLDFDALLAPIPGDNPAGAPVPVEVQGQIDENRREVASTDPAHAKEGDWPEVVRQAKEVLTTTSKSLYLSAILAEALFRVHGFAGLRDGLRLIRELVERAWDRLLPPLGEEDALLDRAAHLALLDRRRQAGSFPDVVRARPLFKAREGEFSFLDWRLSQEKRPGKLGPEEFKLKVLIPAPAAECLALAEDSGQALEGLTRLTAALAAPTALGDEAPRLDNLRGALEDCHRLLQEVAAGKRPAAAAAGPEPAAAPAAAAAGPALDARPPADRAAVYRQLAQAAAVLERLEPHSPVPYLVRRAVELGDLPFPEMIRKLIREASVLAELNRELGIKEPPAEGAG
jgi:type VI secretion system protein ImpA